MRHLLSALLLTSLVVVSAAQSFPSPAKPRIEADWNKVFIIAPKGHVVQSEGLDDYSRAEVGRQFHAAVISDSDPLEPALPLAHADAPEQEPPSPPFDPSPFVVLVLGIAALCRRRR